MNFKLIYSAEGQCKTRWLDELPDWESLGDARIEISEGRRRTVVIAGDDLRTPPKNHLVSFTEKLKGAGREYWQDCGPNLQDACAFALDVMERGSDAFEFESKELARLRELESKLKNSPGRPRIETDNKKTLSQRKWRDKQK